MTDTSYVPVDSVTADPAARPVRRRLGAPPMTAAKRLFWLDLETTGLDPKTDLILEVAVVVTTTDLEEVERFHRVIGQGWRGFLPPNMDDIVREMHQRSGLFDELGASDHHAMSVAHQFKQLADHYPGAYLAGSGVHFDRAFLAAQWPQALKSLHYRNLDVSTIRTFVNLYAPHAAYEPAKAHRAMADVEDAIAELKHYRDVLVGADDLGVPPLEVSP